MCVGCHCGTTASRRASVIMNSHVRALHWFTLAMVYLFCGAVCTFMIAFRDPGWTFGWVLCGVLLGCACLFNELAMRNWEHG